MFTEKVNMLAIYFADRENLKCFSLVGLSQFCFFPFYFFSGEDGKMDIPQKFVSHEISQLRTLQFSYLFVFSNKL
jgi:hypothetical protein